MHTHKDLCTLTDPLNADLVSTFSTRTFKTFNFQESFQVLDLSPGTFILDIA